MDIIKFGADEATIREAVESYGHEYYCEGSDAQSYADAVSSSYE